MFCTKCGAKLPDNARFCTSCGTPVNPSPSGSSVRDDAKNLEARISGALDSAANSVSNAAKEVGGEIAGAINGSFGGNNSGSGYTSPAPLMPQNSYFDGSGAELFGKWILLVLVTVFTLGIATPWMLVNVEKWEAEHSVIDGRRLVFNGTGAQLWGHWLKWWILSVITCGIYSFFAMVDFFKWRAKHTSFEGDAEQNSIYPDSFFDGNSFEYFGYSLICGVITSITLSLAFPWMNCIMERWIKKSTVLQNRRLSFNGTGGELFGTYIVVALLDLITCGIYSAWGECRIKRFMLEHTHCENNYNTVL